MFLRKTKSYDLRNLNLTREPPLPQIEGYQRNSPLCRFFLHWNPTIWGICSPFLGEIRTIPILSCLYHVPQGITAKHSFWSFPHFVVFIILFDRENSSGLRNWFVVVVVLSSQDKPEHRIYTGGQVKRYSWIFEHVFWRFWSKFGRST